MDSVLVNIKNVSKKYCRNLKRSLWYGIKDITRELFGLSCVEDNLRPGEFWALNDVSFELRRGESLGIIGLNGAGKTTLLKMINGLIKPTQGKITVNGTVGALIALGAGFNPILTGRENVRIVGAVLGFSEREMSKKTEEILEFSEIGDFIDSPVQSYSSGMLVRLGFAVAIQMQPNLLLVDEVLAVGDLSFAVKCHKKISEYRNNGGSLILVSHGLHNVRFHCDKAIWLDHGKIKSSGDSDAICREYEIFIARRSISTGQQLYFDDSIKVTDVNYPRVISGEEPFIFEFVVYTKKEISNPVIVFSIYHVNGQHLLSNYSNLEKFSPSFQKGPTTIRIKYDKLFLSSGIYGINLVISEGEVNNHLAFFQNVFRFEVRNSKTDFALLSLRPRWEMSTLS